MDLPIGPDVDAPPSIATAVVQGAPPTPVQELQQQLAAATAELDTVRRDVQALEKRIAARAQGSCRPSESSTGTAYFHPRVCLCGDAWKQTKWGGPGECDVCSGVKFCTSSCYGSSRYCGGCGGKFLPKELRFWEDQFSVTHARKYWSDQLWRRVLMLNKEVCALQCVVLCVVLVV